MTPREPKHLLVSLDGTEHALRVEAAGRPDSFQVHLQRDGATQTRTVRVLAGPPAPVVLIDGRVLRLALGSEHGERRVNRGPHARRARLGANPEALDAERTASAAGLLVAPMPGRVVAVHVQSGDALSKGALLLVIEAMKMQNELFASGAGHVDAVLVKAGDTVERGAALIRIV